MTTTTSIRRVVLVDLDARDADLLPRLLRRPDLSVRLVAGRAEDDLAVRLAALCELPATVELGDLTREIFDLALVGERSPRRTQVEGLLHALGTPCTSPRAFLEHDNGAGSGVASPHRPQLADAAAFESALGGADVEELLDAAWSEAPAGPPSGPPAPARLPGDGLLSPEDRTALESALTGLVLRTGACAAEVHAAVDHAPELVARVGNADPLLSALVQLAMHLDAPQVVEGASAGMAGRAWGAWPFRAGARRGVVAAAGMSTDAGDAWERMVDELRAAWDRDPHTTA